MSEKGSTGETFASASESPARWMRFILIAALIYFATFLAAAHRLRCASAILSLASELRTRDLGALPGVFVATCRLSTCSNFPLLASNARTSFNFANSASSAVRID